MESNEAVLYSIIRCEGEQCVAVVPNIWLDGEEAVLWPDLPSNMKGNLILKELTVQRANPKSEKFKTKKWIRYKIEKIYGSAATYNEAVQLCENLMNSSSELDDEDPFSKSSRASRHKKHFTTSDTSEDDEDDRPKKKQKKTSGETTLLTKASIKTSAFPSMPTDEVIDVDRLENTNSDEIIADSDHENHTCTVETTTTVSQNIGPSGSEPSKTQESQTPRLNKPVIDTIIRIPKAKQIQNKDFGALNQDQKLNYLTSLILNVAGEVALTRSDLQNMQANRNDVRNEDPIIEQMQLDKFFPISTFSVLEDFNAKLSGNVAFENKILKYLNCKGSDSGHTTVRALLKAVVSDDIAQYMNYGGRKWAGAAKRSFSDMQIWSLIKNVAVARDSNYREGDAKKTCERWLQEAKLRLQRQQNKRPANRTEINENTESHV